MQKSARGADLTALTLIPWPAHWLDKALVNWATPPLAATYAGVSKPPWNDISEAMLMIEPRCGGLPLGSLVSIYAPTSRQRVKTAVRLTCRTYSMR